MSISLTLALILCVLFFLFGLGAGAIAFATKKLHNAGTLLIDTTGETTDRWTIIFDDPLSEVAKSEFFTVKVVHKD